MRSRSRAALTGIPRMGSSVKATPTCFVYSLSGRTGCFVRVDEIIKCSPIPCMSRVRLQAFESSFLRMEFLTGAGL